MVMDKSDVYRKIAKDMEKWFRKEKIGCDKCGRLFKFDTFFIDNVEIEPIMLTCRKCRHFLYEEVTTKLAIKEIRRAYPHNKKVREKIIDWLKRGMIKGFKFDD